MRENFSIDEEELGIDPPKPVEIGFTADSAFDEFAVDNGSGGIKWTTENWVNFGEISGNQYLY